MAVPEQDQDAGRARFTHRLVVMEDPLIVEKVSDLAESAGHSVAAEVRGAVRYWIRQWESRDDA